MQLEQLIQYYVDFFPKLNATRQMALDHIFLTIGNGLKWYKGELIPNYYGKIKYDKSSEIIHQNLNGNEYKITLPKIKGKASFNFYEAQVHAMKFSEHIWYPNIKPGGQLKISKCVKPYLFDYPKNIKPDWKAGINETLEMLKADKIKIIFE